MPSPVVVKVASGLGVLGAVGGGAILSKSYLFRNKTTLKSILEKDGWVLLTSSNNKEITEVLDVYKTKQPSPFINFKGDESNASNRLLEECRKLYEKTEDISDKEDLLKKLKRWCVVPQTTKERLYHLKVNLFSTNAPTSNNNESAEWIEKAKGHISTAKNKFSDLTTIAEGSGNDNENAKKLREHCSSKLGVKSTDETFDDMLVKIKLWCSNPQS